MTSPRAPSRHRLWIDLDNSPHVLFFAPLITRLRSAGVEVLVTARAFSQTEELARSHGIDYVLIGEHRTPRTFAGRVTATLRRAWKLARHVRAFRPDAAASHGSRAMVLAAAFLRIPSLSFYDYEYAATFLYNHLSKVVAVPDAIPPDRLGGGGAKRVAYPGFKEEVYLCDFQPDSQVLARLELDPQWPIITVRPPAEWAHYHSDRSARLFRALVDRLRNEKTAQVVILTRTHEQHGSIIRRYNLEGAPFRVLRDAVDGLSLMWYSTAVFSGGGTMVREAALLGVPVYSTFAGTLGAADAALERSGRLTMLRHPEEVMRLQLPRSSEKQRSVPDRRTTDFIFSLLLDFVHGRDHHKDHGALT